MAPAPPVPTVSPLDVTGSPWSGEVLVTSLPSSDSPVSVLVTPDWSWFADVPLRLALSDAVSPAEADVSAFTDGAAVVSSIPPV